MTDIADKIYAATGLTLGAEEAAKIGQMIQVENEKLRAAIKMAIECLEDRDVIGASLTLTKALGEKE
jgi:hypothetical protein